MEKKFKFSVIMPIYNTEPYLAEAIDSVINQTIGFNEHIQIILVNDGSPDNSHEICAAYKKKYPDNVVYVEQENQGVSHARNNGLTYAVGEYVNFFDSDDIWEPEVFQIVSDFFDAHKEEVDAVCGLQKYFESRSGLHGLSKKFENGDRVIDIHAEPDAILLNVTSVFIKTDVARHYTFDTEISIGEDSAYITEVIFEKGKYGVLQSAVYHIRKREAGNSLTQAPSKAKYTKTVDRYYRYLPELSINKFGKVIPYVQYAILNGLKFRILSNAELPLTEEEKRVYIEKITDLIKLLDDEVIINAGRMVPATKIYLLKLKYKLLSPEDFSIEKNILYFRGIRVCNLGLSRLEITSINIENNLCEFSGILAFPLLGILNMQVQIGKEIRPVTLTDHPDLEKYSFTGQLIRKNKEVHFTLPLEKDSVSVRFEVLYDGHTIPQKPVLKGDLEPVKTDGLILNGKRISLNMKKIIIENA